ncbi:MAG: KTSC domain-containing protein [Sulfurimonas sp.]|uniref:KTSC domain-containing protein n=1 Tax=Sulfurimonas sp. TaxID=2022749 RepID=UPI002602AECF|nr:KTSC domain-containing protein [Sulfurimonas sp.]MDD5400952.1 KTSC domain-containing protein [Sulfurimonas sp.]
MQMTLVESSNVKAVGYNKDSSTLQVEFKNGGTYQYFAVPEGVFVELLNSDSVGGYLASDIKGTYKYSKV